MLDRLEKSKESPECRPHVPRRAENDYTVSRYKAGANALQRTTAFKEAQDLADIESTVYATDETLDRQRRAPRRQGSRVAARIEVLGLRKPQCDHMQHNRVQHFVRAATIRGSQPGARHLLARVNHLRLDRLRSTAASGENAHEAPDRLPDVRRKSDGPL
jgi:hypothetical protein